MTLGHLFLGPVEWGGLSPREAGTHPREVELAPADGESPVAVVHGDLFPCCIAGSAF